MNIVQRIEQTAKEKKISIKQLEKETGLGNGIIRKWNKSSPQCNKLLAISNFLGVSIEWLITGKENEITSNERTLILAYNKANEAIKESVNKLLDINIENSEEGKSSVSKTG